MKNKRFFSFLLIMAMVIGTFLSSSGLVLAAEGDGTESSPYLIKTVKDLFSIPAESAEYYKLANDIDVDGLKKEALGEFKGVLDGAGYTIKNLAPSGDLDYIGLFSKTTGATIKNITFENAKAMGIGCSYVGIVTGYATDTIFENCTIKDSEIKGASYVGAIAGYATESKINKMTVKRVVIIGTGNQIGSQIGATSKVVMSNCASVDNTLSGKNHIGGLIGVSTTDQIKRCYSEKGTITVTELYSGGLIGSLSNGSTINQSYSTTDITSGLYYVGGLVGSSSGNDNSISECFTNNQIQGNLNVGGILGIQTNGTMSIENSYSLSSITCNPAPSHTSGGLVGSNITSIKNSFAAATIEGGSRFGLAQSGTMTNSYFDEEVMEISTPESQTRPTLSMYKELNYTGWDFENVWAIEEGKNYPVLKFKSNGSTDPEDENNGEEGSEESNNPSKVAFKMVLQLNEKMQLSLNNNLSVNADAVWTCSDSSIATVDKDGMVKALKAGSTVITVKYEDEDYIEKINVLVVEDATYLRLAVDLKIGEKALATIDDLADTVPVNWSVMNTDVATVSKRGNIIARGKGLTIVTATDSEGNIYGHVYVRVR